MIERRPRSQDTEGTEKCEPNAPKLALGPGADNDTGIFVDPLVPAKEQFRCWVQLAQVLSKNPKLSKTNRLLCGLLFDAANLRVRVRGRG